MRDDVEWIDPKDKESLGIPDSGKWAGVAALPWQNDVVDDFEEVLFPFHRSAKRTVAIMRTSASRIRFFDEGLETSVRKARSALARIDRNIASVREMDVLLSDAFWRRSVGASEVRKKEREQAECAGRAILSLRTIMEAYDEFRGLYGLLAAENMEYE